VCLAAQAAPVESDTVACVLTDVLWCVHRTDEGGRRRSTRSTATTSDNDPHPRPLPVSATLRLLSLECDAPEAAEQRLRLSAVARTCLAAGVVSRNLLLERSEGEFLELLELIPSAEGYKKKEVCMC
jgi:hypothetical protein